MKYFVPYTYIQYMYRDIGRYIYQKQNTRVLYLPLNLRKLGNPFKIHTQHIKVTKPHI